MKLPRPLALLSLSTILAAFGLLAAQITAEIKSEDDFRIEGVGLWQCQCPSHACPCQQNGQPRFGTCYAADFAHITKGQYGKTRLDGLNVVLVGNLVDTKQDRLFGTLYVDQAGTPEQRDALRKMFEYLNSQNVGTPGEQPIPFQQVKAVAFHFSESAEKTVYTLSIPDILEEKAVLQRDAKGQPAHSMPAMDTWSNIVHNADNVKFEYHDPALGKAWDQSGRYANIKYFVLTRDMYANGQMLMLDGDMSGKWTAKQQQLIQRLGLGKN